MKDNRKSFFLYTWRHTQIVGDLIRMLHHPACHRSFWRPNHFPFLDMQKKRFVDNPIRKHSMSRRKSMLSKKKFPALAMPKTGGIVLLPERPEELLDPSQRFVKSPKSSRTSLSPVSSPKNLSGDTSPMLAPQVRTSFWNSKKANQLSKPSKPSPPSQKKTIAQYNSPKLNKVVSNNDGPDLETNEEIKSTGKQTITGNRRRGIIGRSFGRHETYDHHRVQSFTLNYVTWYIGSENPRGRRIVTRPVIPSRIYLVIQMMKLRRPRDYS